MMFGFNPTLTIPRTSTLPVDRRKYDTSYTALAITDDDNDLTTATNAATDSSNRFEGRSTIQLTSVDNALAEMRQAVAETDLSSGNFIDIDYKIDGVSDLSLVAIEFLAPNFSNRYTLYPVGPIEAVTDETWRYGRFPRSRFGTTGSPDWTNVQAVRIYVQGDAGTTVTMNVAKVGTGSNPASIQMHFDDGYLNQYQHGFEVTQDYGLAGTLNVITSWPGSSGTRMTWANVREMASAGWAIASHTDTHVDLSAQTEATIRDELATAKGKLQDQGFWLGSHMLSAPFGGWNASVGVIAADYLKVARTTSVGATWNNEFPQAHPLFQKYTSPTQTDSVATVTGWIDTAIANGEELVLAWHEIIDGATGATLEYSKTDFDSVCSYVRTKIDAGDCISPTMYEVMPSVRNPTPVDEDGDVFAVMKDDRPLLVDLGTSL